MGFGDFLKKIVNGVDRVADDTLEKAVNAHKGIVDRGGYWAATTETVSGVFESTKKAYNSLDEALTTDGEFDPDKAKRLLADQAGAAKQYGVKNARIMGNLVKDLSEEAGHTVKDAVRNKFREYIPTDEERLTRYAGIGTEKSVWFRESYEAVLEFHDSANKILNPRLKLRGEILADIKSSASESWFEISEHYKEQETSVNTAKKLTTVAQYLK